MLSNEDFLSLVEMAPLVSIDLIITNAAGHLMVGVRQNRPAKGSLFVPGGRIRKGERIADALSRISKTETGVKLAGWLAGAFDHFYPDNLFGEKGITTHYVALAYMCQWPSLSVLPTADRQHASLEWVSPTCVRNCALTHPNTIAYLDLIK